MKEVEFTSELDMLLRDGVAKTGRKEIDDAYPDFAQSVPNEVDLAERFSRIMDELDEVLALPSSPDPIRSFRSRGWFYALLAWVDRHVDSAADLREVLPLVAHRIESDRRSNPELERAISGSASDKASRETRLNYLTEAIESL